MKWTKEKPTVKGWYWHKNHNERAKVVEVFKFKPRGQCDDKILGFDYLRDYGGTKGELVSSNTGMWAGPIPEPRE